MPKRSRKEPQDYNVNAARIVAIAIGQEPLNCKKPAKPRPKPGEPKKNPHAVTLGRKGGKVGGKARAAALTAKGVKVAVKSAL